MARHEVYIESSIHKFQDKTDGTFYGGGWKSDDRLFKDENAA